MGWDALMSRKTERETRDRARKRGYRAFCERQPITANPYKPMTSSGANLAWDHGWQQAKDADSHYKKGGQS